jgi:hypothetical protein
MQKLPSTMALEDNMILLAKSDTWYEPHDRFASGLMCFLKYQYQKDSVVIFFIFSSVSFSFTKVALNIYLPLISPQNLVSSNSSAIRWDDKPGMMTIMSFEIPTIKLNKRESCLLTQCWDPFMSSLPLDDFVQAIEAANMKDNYVDCLDPTATLLHI